MKMTTTKEATQAEGVAMSPKRRTSKPTKPKAAPVTRKQQGPVKFPEGMTVEDALRRAMSTPPPKK